MQATALVASGAFLVLLVPAVAGLPVAPAAPQDECVYSNEFGLGIDSGALLNAPCTSYHCVSNIIAGAVQGGCEFSDLQTDGQSIQVEWEHAPLVTDGSYLFIVLLDQSNDEQTVCLLQGLADVCDVPGTGPWSMDVRLEPFVGTNNGPLVLQVGNF